MISSYLQEQLKKENISFNLFQRLVQRLLDFGTLCRDENNTELELYDTYVRIKKWVDDYLSIIGVQVQHDSKFQFVRLFPPGAEVPGLDTEDSPYVGFRHRLNQHEIALILVLRSLYEQRLHEGNIDELGCCAISVESINIAMKSLLNRSLPINLTERKSVFRKLKQLRLIKYQLDDEHDMEEFWFKVRPMITNMVSSDVLDALSIDQEIESSEPAPES